MDIVPCSSYVNRRFGGTYRFHLQGRKSVEQETSEKQVISSSETSANIRTTLCSIPEDATFVTTAVQSWNAAYGDGYSCSKNVTTLEGI
jgi:hypothetical protein